MEGRDVLQHLLQVESEASSLSTEAAAEAERRVSDRERVARDQYSLRYEGRVTALNGDFEREAAAIDAEYRRCLDAYRRDLEAKAVDFQRFCDEASAHLIQEK